ncbi:MAG: GDSL-type esterase/lipase family protein [Candidatus Ornithomonoglobus sp.]
MAVSRRMWLREQERKRRERQRRARRRRNIAIAVFLLAAIAVVVIVMKGLKNSKPVKVDDPKDMAAAEQTSQNEVMPNAGVYTGTQAEVSVNADYFDNSVFIGNALAAGIDAYGILPYTDFYAGVHITLDNVYTTAANNSSMAVIDQLKSQKFNKVFISFGETELSWGDASQFADAYEELLERVKSYQQSANIYIISIPPIAETASVAGSGYSQRTIKAYNKALKIIAAQEKVYYVDSFEALGGNYLPAGVSSDGVNLNKTYYAKLLNYAQTEAEIPDITDISDDDEENIDSEEDTTDGNADGSGGAEETGSRAADNSSVNNEEPTPTVNVLKSTGNTG